MLNDVATTRASIGQGWLWDIGLSQRALNQLEPKAREMHRALRAGAIWTAVDAHKAGHQASAVCRHCGCAEGN
eukprot:15233957-Alexandrium_andersonii.AAC.1